MQPRTAKDITDSETLFRFGIVSLFLVVGLDVVVAWALYRVFRAVSEGIAMLAPSGVGALAPAKPRLTKGRLLQRDDREAASCPDGRAAYL